MLKKLCIVFALFSLTACVAYYPYPDYQPRSKPISKPSYDPPLAPSFETQTQRSYPKEKKGYYKISTEHMNKFIQAKNNVEYCLLPELGQQEDARLTALEKHLVKAIIHEQLENIVNKSSAKVIYDDPDAYGYFEFKYQQLKHDLTNIRESECRQLKERYNQRFKDLKRQRGLENRSGHPIERRIQDQQQAIEDKIRDQQMSIERKMREQQEAMERKILGQPEPMYKPKRDISIDWSHPLDRW
ncbi:TPA: hypothetical protein QB286_000767 [Pasteurella multocida]|nr:hypothetical protein [Pasteurella multocida]HDR1189969.1 hypothetical protein [Pasteurella multocida]HDR1192846.1 hypothetical protein [Pasteurella multocida]HDR1200049.1 hypothetical protein [Pasteurella multocida]HDR1211459.1 hypothetical protein [Pasteurella multocida]